jgi:molecular chaperone GrpE
MSKDQSAPAAPPDQASPRPAEAGTSPEQGGDGSAERLTALETQLAAAQAEAEQLRDQALRARAEAENVRKRTERDLENAHKYALERFVAELLPVKDSLELGLSAARDGAAIEDLREGTQMTLRLLSSAVEKFAVREIDPLGEPFDPQLHQAMSAQEREGVAAGTVLQVVQKGYLLNERLVRPALVIVAK